MVKFQFSMINSLRSMINTPHVIDGNMCHLKGSIELVYTRITMSYVRCTGRQ